jgi:hypothetical protein
MASRWWSLAIVLFWLVIMGPLLVREASEQLNAYQQPPRFTIDLVDEAQKAPTLVRWKLLSETKSKVVSVDFFCSTWVDFNAAEDSFEMHIKPSFGDGAAPGLPLRPTSIEGVHTVSRDGRLVKTRFTFTLPKDLTPPRILMRHADDLECNFEGRIVDGKLHATLTEAIHGSELSHPYDPIPLSRDGAIFNPMHPVKRLADRRPGQRWQVPLIDPVRDVFELLNDREPSHSFRMVSAHVQEEPQKFRLQSRDVNCLVIDYTDEGKWVASTWIEMNSGLVVRQMTEHDGRICEFLRESS